MSDQPHEQPHGPEHGEAHAAEAAAQDPMQPQEMLHVDKYEGWWMRISVVVVVIMVLAITIAGFGVGVQVPGQYARITPEDLADPDNPFANPGLRELAPGKYEAYIVAQTWSFLPAEIRVPAGSEVTFYITARDVQHGFKLLDTNINVMALPGQVSTLKATFDEPGTYDYICHEYCGYVAGSPIGHHTMYGQLIVEEPAAEEAAAAAN
jgi:cytochrome c oxidase subunit 2